jgi:BTB/POZ domain
MIPDQPHQDGKSPGQVYFDVDGDKELQKLSSDSNEGSRQTWRGDPNDTGSDCTIVVVTETLHTATFYVHKSFVCFGTRHSKYFAKHLLQSTEPNKVPSTKIELDQRDADNFPIFLDFMYRSTTQPLCGATWHQKATLSNETMETVASSFSSASLNTPQSSQDESCLLSDDENITTENAVSLRHMGRLFENDALIRFVNKFIQKDLNFTTGPAYLYTAWEYKDDRLVESSQRLCAENIEHIDIKALIRLPIHLFRVVIKTLESFEKENEELSIRLSEVVCRYLEKHPKARNAELLLELTDPLLMPYIASEAAIGYTAIVKDLEPDDAAKHWSRLVRLCRRCAKAVVKEYGWSDFSVNAAVNEYLVNPSRKGKSSQPIVVPNNIDSLLFATSFAAALEQAQEDYEDISSTYNVLDLMISTLHGSVSALETANQHKDAYIEKQKLTIASNNQEIFALKRQIDNMKRQQSLPPPQRRYSPPMNHPRIHQQSPDVQASEPHSTSDIAGGGRQYSRMQYGSPLRPSQTSGSHEQSIGGQRQYPSPHRIPQQQQHPPTHVISSPVPMARQRVQNQTQQSPIYQKVSAHQQQRQSFGDNRHRRSTSPPRELPPDLLEMNLAYHAKDLISPTQVGIDVHMNKNRTRQELKTKSEMRSKSLLV